MPQLSFCPRCEQSVLIPTRAEAHLHVCCPLCGGQYPLIEAMGRARPLPPGLIVLTQQAQWAMGPDGPQPASVAADPIASALGLPHDAVVAPLEGDAAAAPGEPTAKGQPLTDDAERTQEMPALSAGLSADDGFFVPIDEHEQDAFEGDGSPDAGDERVDSAMFGGASRFGAFPGEGVPGGEDGLQPEGGVATATLEGEAPVPVLQRIAARVQGPEPNPIRGLITLVGLVVFGFLGMFVAYYAMCLISPSFNFLHLRLPLVAKQVRVPAAPPQAAPLPKPAPAAAPPKAASLEELMEKKDAEPESPAKPAKKGASK